VVGADQPRTVDALQHGSQADWYDAAVRAGEVDFDIGDERVIGELPVFQDPECGTETHGLLVWKRAFSVK
jgi:hypothetical protein